MTERFVASPVPDGWVVWDVEQGRQHDPVPYRDREAAERRADLANQADLGELDHLRDPHWITD